MNVRTSERSGRSMGAAIRALAILGLFGCTQPHAVDAPDIDLPAPGEAQIASWAAESFRRDPCQVAHYELQLRLDVLEWRGERYNPRKYVFYERDPEHPEWGSYVVRGYTDRSGRLWRYRVKLRRAGDIWIATQISHYLTVELEHPALERDSGPPK
ncbi:MAG: hypothetical protein HYY16_16795 [Planctomycetes bacterium]|nr:hypothetical protein [Planctomycetota bacterium]